MSINRPHILMCPPEHYGIEYEINPWMNRERGADHALAVRQWESLVALLKEVGAQISLLSPVKGLPDLVFTANAALMAFTKALGGQSLDFGVRVVGVNPGPVETERMVKINKRRALDWYGDETRWTELREKYPGGRPASAEEVADLMVFLASPRAGYVTGSIVTIDGGIAARGSIIKERSVRT